MGDVWNVNFGIINPFDTFTTHYSLTVSGLVDRRTEISPRDSVSQLSGAPLT